MKKGVVKSPESISGDLPINYREISIKIFALLIAQFAHIPFWPQNCAFCKFGCVQKSGKWQRDLGLISLEELEKPPTYWAMLQRLITCVALACALFATRGTRVCVYVLVFSWRYVVPLKRCPWRYWIMSSSGLCEYACVFQCKSGMAKLAIGAAKGGWLHSYIRWGSLIEFIKFVVVKITTAR